MTKEIVSISLGSASGDYDLTTSMFGEEIHVRRLGVGGSVDRARQLVAQFDGQVDVISLGGVALYFQVGHHTYVHEQIKQVAGAARLTPVVDGTHLKNTFERWAIGRLAQDQRSIFSQKRIFVVSGIGRYALAEVLSGYTQEIRFGDPIFQLNLPYALRSLEQVERYAALVLPALCRAPYSRLLPTGVPGAAPTSSEGEGSGAGGAQSRRKSRGTKYFAHANIIAGDLATIRSFAPEDLHGKMLITDDLSAADVQDLRRRGVESLVTFTPPLDDRRPFVGTDVLEAVFLSVMGRPWSEVTDDDYLNLVDRSGLRPHITVLNEPRDVARYAFVIHPLTVDNIFNHPVLKYLRWLPHRLVESVVAQIRPLYVSRITGVRSAATGKEVEGYLITLGATPRELMHHKPGFTYRRLIVASRMAQQLGAQIMGLGAFTKVVGDAGMTVAYKSDIPITSGNSLTVAATLEAAKQAVLKMGGRVDQGRAVVIGATGSIGAVCSRLLAQAIHDVVLVAPRPEKLIPLKQTIMAETPGARVTIAMDASPHLADADLVVTTTTAIGEKVIDVLKLKPGCVVCDVARPPDVQEHDARLRPDVLVIESGEILLPGQPDFGFNIGLPPGVAYACLAETALLAMEGRFESFTLGRNIEMDRVKEIYRLFKRHGLQLEGLRSFGRYVTDEEIAAKRELADELRTHPERLESIRRPGHQASDTAPTVGTGTVSVSRARAAGHGGLWAAIVVGVGSAGAAVAWLLARRKRS